ELIARIHAVLRRVILTPNPPSADQAEDTQILMAPNIKVIPDRFEAYFHDELLTLTRKEFELLSYFVQHQGLILSRDQLLQAVWDYDFAGDTRIVDVHVGRLREKLE